MPTSMVTATTPSSSSVVAALRLFGGLNAGTPLEIASTPVSAAQPEENARSSRNTNAKPVDVECSARDVQAGARRPEVVAEHEDPEQAGQHHPDDRRS